MGLIFKTTKQKLAILQAKLMQIEAEEKEHIPSTTSREILEKYKIQKQAITDKMRQIAYDRIVVLDRKTKRLGAKNSGS